MAISLLVLPSIRPAIRLFEGAIVAIAAIQIIRIALKPPFRRDMAASPVLALTGWVAALGVGGLVVWFLARSPLGLDLVAVVAALGMAGAWWRARPGFGRARGMPPGSLGIIASLDAIDDRNFYADQARLHGPIFKMSQFGRPVVCVVGLARAREVLHAPAGALAGATLPYNQFLPKGSLRYMTSDDHQREAPIFRTALASVSLEASETAARTACRRTLAAIATDSTVTPGGVATREYLESWVVAALARTFFGLEPTDPRIGTLARLREALVVDRMGGWGWRRRSEIAFQGATELIRGFATTGDVSGSALGALLAADPRALDNPTRVRNLFLFYRLGTGDVAGLLEWLLSMLNDNPAWQERVRSASRLVGTSPGAQPADLASRIVLETLRLEQSEYLYRQVTAPLAIGDYRIPAGWLLRICVQESHRDPVIFPNPDRFDPDRFLGRTIGRAEYSPFGADNRGCLGVSMVHFMGRIFVEELCHGYRWRVTQDGPLERGSRHRHHWRPSSRRRLVMTPLDGREPPAEA